MRVTCERSQRYSRALASRSHSFVNLRLSGTVVDLTMELDTGAAISIISHCTYCSTWPVSKRSTLRPSTARLCTYSGEILTVLGSNEVTASYHNQSLQRSLLVVPTDGPTLFGQNWLRALNQDWKELHNMQVVRQQALQDVLTKHSTLFRDEMGTLKPLR